MPGPIFDNSYAGSEYEDTLSMLTALEGAQPAERDAFLKSIVDTPMGDNLANAVKTWTDIKNAGQPSLSKSFNERIEQVSKPEAK